MPRLAPLLCVFITLMFSSAALSDGNIDSVLRQLENHDSYSLEIEGRDGDGEFSATYLYTPDLQLLRRKDRDGTSTYLYDKLKRPDKVMVTRAGVAYLYRLDNPRLPAYVPGSLLEYYLQEARDSEVRVTKGPDGIFSGLEYGDYSNDGAGFLVSSVVFNPDLDDPQFARMANYLRGD